MDDPRTTRRRYVIGFGIWTLIGLNSALQWVPHRIGTGAEVWAVGLFAFIHTYIWAALYPLISATTRAVARRSRGWLVTIALHLPMALLFAAVHLGTYYANYLFFKHFIGVDYYRLDLAGFVGAFYHGSVVFYVQIVAVVFILDYRRRLKEKDQELTRAQLRSLKMQIQPHFLFNTLHSIHASIEEDPATAEAMLVNLSDFLRKTLATSEETEITLEEEIEFVRAYLSIEQTRFRDRLSTAFELEPDSRRALVPALLLQPLVENAIRHGIAPSARPGTIRIASSVQGSELVIAIQNSGSPRPESRARGSSTGMGLAHTRKRLETHFAQTHRLEVEPGSDGSFSVTVAIPLRKRSAGREHEPTRAQSEGAPSWHAHKGIIPTAKQSDC